MQPLLRSWKLEGRTRKGPQRRAAFTATGQPLWVLLLALVAVAAPAWSTTAAEKTPPTPPTAEALEQSIAKGVAFLVQRQNKDGSWGSAHRTKDLNIFAPVPGAHHAFRCGVTALCVESLLATGAAQHNPAVRSALDGGEAWLLANLPKLRRADGVAIYNIWGHAYGIQALAAMHREAGANTNRQQQIRELIATQLDRLRRYESVDGGWGYYDFAIGAKRPSSWTLSFVSATVLLAFQEAKTAGVNPPEDLIKRAVASIQRQRKNDNSYLYGEYLKMRPMREVNRPAGSLGRSQACNLALRVYGDTTITTHVLTTWLDRLIERNDWLSIGRKRPVPHESWFQVAGYFFYYGHYYAALCLEQLDRNTAAPYRGRLAAILLPLQETDGSWWDFPFYDYHQPYGTAFALMSLTHCRAVTPEGRATARQSK